MSPQETGLVDTAIRTWRNQKAYLRLGIPIKPSSDLYLNQEIGPFAGQIRFIENLASTPEQKVLVEKLSEQLKHVPTSEKQDFLRQKITDLLKPAPLQTSAAAIEVIRTLEQLSANLDP